MTRQKELVARMRFIMKEKKVTQQKLADVLGISRSAVSRILTMSMRGDAAIEHLQRGINYRWPNA